MHLNYFKFLHKFQRHLKTTKRFISFPRKKSFLLNDNVRKIYVRLCPLIEFKKLVKNYLKLMIIQRYLLIHAIILIKSNVYYVVETLRVIKLKLEKEETKIGRF